MLVRFFACLRSFLFMGLFVLLVACVRASLIVCSFSRVRGCVVVCLCGYYSNCLSACACDCAGMSVFEFLPAFVFLRRGFMVLIVRLV